MTRSRKFTQSLTLLLLFSFAASPLALLADQNQEPQAQATLEWEDEADQELPIWRKAMHWFFTTAVMATNAATLGARHFYPEKMAKKLFSASDTLSPELKAITQNTIQDFGLKPEDITLLNSPTENIGMTVGGSTIILNEKMIEKYTPQEARFLIGHELAHLENNDILKLACFALAAPFIAHFGLKAWDAGVKKALSSIKKVTNTKRGSRTDTVLKKIHDINHWLSTFCITKIIVAGQLFLAYSRYREKQADLASLNRLGECDGAQKLFKRIQEEIKAIHDNNAITRRFTSPEGDNYLDTEHPLLSERLAYTKEYCQQHCNA